MHINTEYKIIRRGKYVFSLSLDKIQISEKKQNEYREQFKIDHVCPPRMKKKERCDEMIEQFGSNKSIDLE